MRYLTCIILFLTINCHSQEVIKLEHWDDKYNNGNEKEIKKTQEFIKKNKLKLFEVYNAPLGVKNRYLDSLPYVFIKNMDTIIYLSPGGLFPTAREDFKEIYMNDNKGWSYYIEGVRKDGRLGVITLQENRFVRKENQLYYTYLTSSLKREEENKLYDKLFESKSEKEKKLIDKEIMKYKFYKYELIFDFNKQIKACDKIAPESNRYSQLIEVVTMNNKEFFKFRTNISFVDLIEKVFIIDKDCNFFLIDGHEVKKVE